MNILIDTHILIWAINDDEKLTDKAREILSDKLFSGYDYQNII